MCAERLSGLFIFERRIVLQEKTSLVKTRHGILISLIITLIVPCASWAWKIGIDSALVNFRYVYASQVGSNGFFGPFNTDMSSLGGDLASMNGWFQRRMLSGTTAVLSNTRLILFPSLTFNNAVSLKGTYRIAPENNQEIVSLLDPDLETPFSRGTWTRLWMQVNTPLGNISYGKRGFQQGCGLQFSSAETAEDILDLSVRTVELFEMQSFYGPLTVGAGFYPWRRGSLLYWNFEDQNAAQTLHALSYVQYTAGNIDAGLGGFYWTFEEGPQAMVSTTTRVSTPPSDTSATEGWVYFKYNNGTLFFNAEADWYYSTVRYRSSQDGTFFGDPAIPFPGGGSRFAPRYVESWRYMVELGGLIGPSKLSFLWCHMPGPDRRHGILIDKQPIMQEPEKSAYGVFYPYCLLMSKYYRAGVDSYRDMSASDVLAGQLSHMLASNLDIVTSMTVAWRASHGYGYGYVRPNPTNPGDLSFGNRGTFADPSPSIPNSDLGWEFDVGVGWKLLQNWELSLRAAYWQPGKWFNFACIDKSVSNWNNPSSLNDWGTNPNRDIAPIMGIELYLNAKL
jgi:hypothetical protein